MKIRTSFTLIALVAALGTQGADGALSAKYLNEWMFDQDSAGSTLSGSINSGADGAAFSADTVPVTQTDGIRGLICANTVSATANLWSDGAVLTAAVTNQSAGVRFLRYDFDYDMSNISGNTGTLLALAFSDGTATNLAGVGLKCDVDSSHAVRPAGLTETTLRELELTGSLSVIAKVDLDSHLVSVWYDLSGGNTFSASNSPTYSFSTGLTSISGLVFQATGEFVASSSNDCVTVDNIRTAATWAEIIEPVVDLTAPPALTVSVAGSLLGSVGEVMEAGQTNVISVTVSNESGFATNVTALLTFGAGEGLSIINSNNTPTLIGGGRSVTHTFSVVATQDGAHPLTVQASSTETTSAAVTFPLWVGPRISYLSPFTITNEVGGTVSGRAEPGETFDLIINNVNDGPLTVSGITNSLIPANSVYFPEVYVTNTSDTYASMLVGDTNSTTYHVVCDANAPLGLQTFYVVNSSSVGTWTNQFQLNLFRGDVLSLSTNALTMVVSLGGTNTANVTLTNGGNVATPFALTYGGEQPTTSYNVEATTETLVGFRPFGLKPATEFSSWSGTTTASMDIGFDFSLFGTNYTSFTVSQSGFLTLKAADNSKVKVTPFQTSAGVAQSTVRYEKRSDRLVVAWGYDGVSKNGSEFQVWLNADGTVQYLYEYGTWGSGTIAIGDQTITYTPGQYGRECLLLTPSPWFTCDPSSGTISGFGTNQTLTFIADASSLAATTNTTTNTFTTTVTGNSSFASLAVTVIVVPETIVIVEPTLQLDVPNPFTFYGPAGSISPSATMTVTNSGNVPVTYSIVDTGFLNGGYTNEMINYRWYDIPVAADYILDESKLGVTAVPIGFPFVFNGNTYTSMVVNADGTLSLGSEAAGGYDATGLSMDYNSSVRILNDFSMTRCVVTWENLALAGNGSDQTFQTVLYRDGSVYYNYKHLDNAGGFSFDGTILSETVYTIGNASLVSSEPVGNLGGLTNMIYILNRVSIAKVPVDPLVITYSPFSGTIPIGATADIILKGDARSLTVGANSASIGTTLTFYSGTNSLATNSVTFTVTNSVETAFSAALVESAWGAESPLVSSQQNSDGSRSLSWPAPADGLSRLYTIWYTTNLNGSWQVLATVDHVNSYVDSAHAAESVIFYKVTVQ